jgi:hypothetical protein
MRVLTTLAPGCRPHGARAPQFLTVRRRALLAHPSSVIGIFILLFGCSESALVTEQARLHKAPAAQSEVVALIPKGSRVEASACSDGWCRVKWNGKDGYALAKNLLTQSQRPAGSEGRNDELYGGEDTDNAD